ncbi:hypothetical protein ACFQT4_03080 [Pseudoduganella danionis]|uniref:hypothetical protein n=1 Tax=Pseudoduganella danionis TaxID=1890295 RepID=UPI00360C42A2
MTTNVTFPIEFTLKNFHTPKADSYVSNFFANNGHIVMAPDNRSFYKSAGHVNGLEKNGTIYIGTQSIDNYAKKMDIPPVWAARDLAIHELGHVAYQQRDYESNPGDNAPMSAKIDWCLNREAEATFFPLPSQWRITHKVEICTYPVLIQYQIYITQCCQRL